MIGLTPTAWTGPVRRVSTNTGSRVEPPFGAQWSDADQLLWHAAVTALDTGLTIRVHKGGYSIRGRRQGGYYSIQIGRSSCGPMRSDAAWKFLSGVTVGAREARRLS